MDTSKGQAMSSERAEVFDGIAEINGRLAPVLAIVTLGGKQIAHTLIDDCTTVDAEANASRIAQALNREKAFKAMESALDRVKSIMECRDNDSEEWIGFMLGVEDQVRAALALARQESEGTV